MFKARHVLLVMVIVTYVGSFLFLCGYSLKIDSAIAMALATIFITFCLALLLTHLECYKAHCGKAIKIRDIPKRVECRVMNVLGNSEFIEVNSWRKEDEEADFRIIQVENPKNFTIGMEFKRSQKFKPKDFEFLNKSRFILDSDLDSLDSDVLLEITSTAEQTVARVAARAER